jgi:hypothetical protein
MPRRNSHARQLVPGSLPRPVYGLYHSVVEITWGVTPFSLSRLQASDHRDKLSAEYSRAIVPYTGQLSQLVTNGLVRLDGLLLTAYPRRWIALARYGTLRIYPAHQGWSYIWGGSPTGYIRFRRGPDIGATIPGLPALVHPNDDPNHPMHDASP